MLDHVGKVGRGLGEVSCREAQMRAHFVQTCIIRRQLQRGVLLGKRALVAAFPGERDGAIGATAHVARLEFERLGVVRNRAVVVAARIAHVGAPRIGLCFKRIEPQRGFKVGQRPVVVLLQLIGAAAKQMSQHVLGLEADRVRQVGYGAVKIAAAFAQEAALEIIVGIVRVGLTSMTWSGDAWGRFMADAIHGRHRPA
jgi:hypothetical protein